MADHFIKISSSLLEMATADTNQLERFATKAADIFEKARVKIVWLSPAKDGGKKQPFNHVFK